MNKKRMKLKAKNFWRQNERLILLISVAFIVGASLMLFNLHQNQQNMVKFQLDKSMPIDNEQDASFEFKINEPSLAKGTTISLTFSNVSSGNGVEVYFNGESVESVNSRTALIKPSSENIQVNNTVRITRPSIGFQSQALVDAEVTSQTNFQQLMFVLFNLFSLLLMAAPIMYVKYEQYIARKKMEEKFPEFLRDVVEGTRAGMSLPQAIQNTETGSYGPLDEKIEKMNAQLDWGVPFQDVLQNFAEETHSDVVRRSVDTIIQAYSSGGNIQDVLESVGDNIRTIKQLKEERESQLYGEMVTGYIVFFIFIGILVALTNYLLPNLADAQQSLGGSGGFSVLGGGGGGASLQQNINLYNSWFSRLVYFQAIFSGLIIGKLAEGELKAGFKHMAVLFAIGYLATTFFL
ncbi:MAG: type II secretion system F family protein [Nanohaloarchaea archaeon]|nr:type II secretion system F family protein [Candidatus Nanohaloarchaea archaeon]